MGVPQATRACALALLVSCTAFAQEPVALGARTSANLVVQPALVNIAGIRGRTHTQTLVAHGDTSAPGLTGLVLPIDMTADNGRVFPEGALVMSAPIPHPGGVESFTLSVDLGKVGAGRYEGTALLGHDRGMHALPIRVEVKDRPILALLLMLFGVGLGTAMTRYQASGLDRDALLVRLGRLPPAEGPDAPPSPWSSRMRQLHASARSLLQREAIDEASAVVEALEALWQRWEVHQDAWRALDTHGVELLAAANTDSPRALAFRQEVETLQQQMPEAEGPFEVKQALDTLRIAIQDYLHAREQVDQLAHIDDPELAARADGLRARLRDPEADLAAIATDASALLRELPDEHDGPMALGELRDPQPGLAPLGVLRPPLPTPEQASGNLQRFALASTLVGVAALASAGFYELYVNNPVFGAHPWSDYAALVAWGLFSENTRHATWAAARPD